jgi:glycosyltransferase involved in cell wall biosynthesis
MKDDKEIEVIVFCSTYNHEPYIRSALDGFVMQKTNFRFQVIVHDDASTDDTASIVRGYEVKYPEIFNNIYETENQYSQNKSYRRELTPKLNYGKYVALCEGDDYWIDPYKLQKQYDFMEANSDYSACTHETILKFGEDTKKFTKKYESEDFTLLELLLWGRNPKRLPHTSSYFLRKEFSLCPEFMIINHIGDYPTMIWAALHGKVYFRNDVMSVYQPFNQGSWTSKQSIEQRVAHTLDIANMIKKIDKMFDYKYTEDFCKAILSHKYYASILLRRFKPIYYDSYQGNRRKYGWGLMFRLLLSCPYRIMLDHIPLNLKLKLKKLLRIDRKRFL